MVIHVNGQPTEVAANATVEQLLDQLEMKSKYVAVERNCELIPRGEHAECRLEEGDAMEIVTLVGGG